MIKYHARAARALGFLKNSYNDIEIYVEDTANQNIWLRLLRRLIPDDVNLSSVNMLGGRQNVIKACRLDQATDARKRLYIIDGDFDHVLGRRKPSLKHLHRLDAYCLENILINEDYLREIVIDFCSNTSASVADSLLDYHGVLEQFETPLRALFLVYAIATKLKAKVKSVGLGSGLLLDSTPEKIRFSAQKILSRAKEILKKLVKQHGYSSVKKVARELQGRAMNLPVRKVVSGKEYLFQPMFLHLRRACRFNGSEDNLKVLLAKEVQAHRESVLSHALKAALA